MKRRRKIEFGTGLYGMAELARYVALHSGASGAVGRVPYWVNHALTPPAHRRQRPDYGFLELISLFVVRDLVAAGLKLHQIRTAEAYLQKQLNHPRPFASERIYSDGANVFFDASPAVRQQITAADLEGQEAMRDLLQIDLKGVGYKDGTAAHWDAASQVVLDPDVQFGEPCVAGTRIQTRQLAALAARGQSPTRLAESYELPVSSVRSALKFEDALASV